MYVWHFHFHVHVMCDTFILMCDTFMCSYSYNISCECVSHQKGQSQKQKVDIDIDIIMLLQIKIEKTKKMNFFIFISCSCSCVTLSCSAFHVWYFHVKITYQNLKASKYYVRVKFSSTKSEKIFTKFFDKIICLKVKNFSLSFRSRILRSILMLLLLCSQMTHEHALVLSNETETVQMLRCSYALVFLLWLCSNFNSNERYYAILCLCCVLI